MRIVFIGATKFGLRCLDLLQKMPCCEVVGAITAPQTFTISYRPGGVTNVLHADVKSYCEARGIKCVSIECSMKNPALFNQVMAMSPDICIVAGWYHMIPKSWIEFAPAYGLHASLLPDYSGGAPLVWAMINGEQKTGITFFKFADGVDNGPIVGQMATDITSDDTIATLYERIESLGIALIQIHLPRLADGTAQLIPQDENRRRLFPQRSPEDGQIDWLWSADRIYNFIRAQSRPYPGAFTRWQGQRLVVWSANKSGRLDSPCAVPGQVLEESDALLVQTGRGVLKLIEVEYKAKAINGREFRSVFSGRSILGK